MKSQSAEGSAACYRIGAIIHSSLGRRSRLGARFGLLFWSALIGYAGLNSVPCRSMACMMMASRRASAIRGFHGVTLLLEDAAKSGAILTNVFGFEAAGREGSISRYRAPNAAGGVVDIYEAKGFLPGRLGRGSVHHIAFRAANDAVEAEMAHKLVNEHNMHPTEQKDRNYFRSIYFREPGGILFEIATDEPGFAVDEPLHRSDRL